MRDKTIPKNIPIFERTPMQIEEYKWFRASSRNLVDMSEQI